MAKYTVAVDMDGVLYPFDDAFNRVSVRHGGKTHDFEEFINFSEVFGDEVVDKVWADPDLFLIEQPYEHVVHTMELLRDLADVEVYIVTNPGRNPHITIPSKWKWIQQQLPWIHPYYFVTTHAKWLFKTDLIVEDHPPNIRKFLKHNPDSSAVMIKRKWNERKLNQMMNRGVYVLPHGIAGLSVIVEFLTDKTFEEAVNE